MPVPAKVVIIADPGIDTAFAIALALHDPAIDVVALLATGGNVSSEQATQNVHILLEQMDPPRWPRLGSAPLTRYDYNGSRIHGPSGLGASALTSVKKHAPASSDRLLIELVREFPNRLTILALGPLSVLAMAFDRDPELPRLIERIIAVGGTWRESGDVTPVADLHLACDPQAARIVLQSQIPITLLPRDVTNRVMLSPTDLLELPNPESRTCAFLREIAPYGIRAMANLYGVEGFYLADVLAVAALQKPTAIVTREVHADVETRGELTRGMLVVDIREPFETKPNVNLATGVDVPAVRAYLRQILSAAP